MDSLTDDELLFFGSVITNLAYYSGTVKLSDQHSFNELKSRDRDDEFVSHAAAAKPLSPDDTEWHRLALPDMPTTFIRTQANIRSEQKIPDELCRPLIRTKLPSHLTGIISGTRSALIKSRSSKWYRLKGCGNNTDGFPIQPVSNSNIKSTIRGCAFLHTTYRELYMTNYISRLLAQHRIECANVPIGWFEYEPTREDSELISSDIPSMQDKDLHRWPTIVRSCILMETLNNKRLADHVLLGMEKLFDSIVCNNKSHPVNLWNLLELFPSDRLIQLETNDDQRVPLSTWFIALSNNLEQLANYKSTWLDSSSRFSNEIPSDIDDDRWKILWQTNIEIVNNYLQSNASFADLFHTLYKRFGFECGSILGLMHHHRVSWGTYTDALGLHCNAHPNNMVIKLPASNSFFFLAPLDFDMSFTETSYLPSRGNNQSFDEIIALELCAFRLTLSGDSQTCTGVTAWIEMPDVQWTSVRWLFRDIMLAEFNRAYDQALPNGSVDFFSDEYNPVLYALIRLALIRTMNEIG